MPAEPQRFVQSVELCESQLRGLERDRAETDEAVRVAAADIGNEIVDGARRLEAEIGVGAVIGLARRRRDRLDVDPHPVHVLDPLLGRRALSRGPHAVLPIDLAAARVGRGFEKPARDIGITFDHRSRLLAADMAVDVDREPLAAGMGGARKSAGERLRSRRQAFEKNILSRAAHSGLLGISMFNSRAALPPRIARRSLSSSPRAPSMKPIGSTSPISAG